MLKSGAGEQLTRNHCPSGGGNIQIPWQHCFVMPMKHKKAVERSMLVISTAFQGNVESKWQCGKASHEIAPLCGAGS